MVGFLSFFLSFTRTTIKIPLKYFFSGSRGPHGPDLPSPFGRKFHIALIMQLKSSLQLSRLDKVICYSTFCDDQVICLTCISIFVIREVFEDNSLTEVGFFSLTTTIPPSS